MSRVLVRNLVTVFVLLCVGFFLNSMRAAQETEAKFLLGKRQEMLRVINQANQKHEEYQANYGSLPQPVPSGSLDQVQNLLISKMKASGLEVLSLVKTPAPLPVVGGATGGKAAPRINSVIYEATINGTWEASMNYLNGLKNEGILLQVQSIQMEAANSGSKVKTMFKYKIFIES